MEEILPTKYFVTNVTVLKKFQYPAGSGNTPVPLGLSLTINAPILLVGFQKMVPISFDCQLRVYNLHCWSRGSGRKGQGLRLVFLR